MMYTRNYDVKPPAPVADAFVPFMMALEGKGYEDPVTGDIRVRTGTNYIRFLNNGSVGGGHVAACSATTWPGETRASWVVDVDISLKIWRK
jgi:hypothetical protein